MYNVFIRLVHGYPNDISIPVGRDLIKGRCLYYYTYTQYSIVHIIIIIIIIEN